MAKIYETREDVERERLARDALRARDATSTLWNTGLLSLLVGSLMLDRKNLNIQLKNTKTGWDKFHNGFDKIGGWLMVGMGAFSAISSFLTMSAARKTERDLKNLGPQEVQLPQGVLPADVGDDKLHSHHTRYLVQEREKEVIAPSFFK